LTPRLGFCTSELLKNGFNQLSYSQESTFGLNAVELHALVDWLESPDYPRGFHSFDLR